VHLADSRLTTHALLSPLGLQIFEEIWDLLVHTLEEQIIRI
jgi:hypothetical protein